MKELSKPQIAVLTTVASSIKAFYKGQFEMLNQAGIKVTVICADDPDMKNFLPAGTAFIPVDFTRRVNPLKDIKALYSLFRIFRKKKFGLVQYSTPKAALIGSTASFLARVPVRIYLLWGLYYETQKGFKRFLFKTIEKFICKLSTAIRPDSKGCVKLAIEEGLCKADKISVIGNGSANGVDTEKFNPDKLLYEGKLIRKKLGIPDNSTVLGCIAAITGDKGINELVEAFEVISQEYPNIYLLYISQATEKDTVKETTLKIMQNHQRIIHIGWQTEPEKYLAAMDIFILPTYREGLGVVNIEASAMKLPVISTDIPGPQETIVDGQTGILVPVKKVKPLIKAIKTLLDRPLYGEKLGEAGRKRVQDLYEQKNLWKEILKHHMSLLQKTKMAEN